MSHEPKNVRVFLGVALPSILRHELLDLQHRLQETLPPIKWVRPESIHLTVKFLGSIDSLYVNRLHEAVLSVCGDQSVFSLIAQGLGVFPHSRNPRIVWVGLTGNLQPLLDVVFWIEEILEPLGFQPEGKPYHPHITLARIKQDGARVGSALTKGGWLDSPQNFGAWDVRGVTLFQSILGQSGAEYVPLWTVPFKEVPS